MKDLHLNHNHFKNNLNTRHIIFHNFYSSLHRSHEAQEGTQLNMKKYYDLFNPFTIY